MQRQRAKRLTDLRKLTSRAPGARPIKSARVVRGLRRNPVLYAIIAVIFLLLISSMATGFDLAIRLIYILLFLIAGSWVWSIFGASQIEAEAQRPRGPFSVGDTVTETISLKNGGGSPKAWVEVEDTTSIPGVSFKHVTGLGITVPFTSLEASATLTKRGSFTLGPLVVRVSDPFTLFPQQVEFEGEETVLVYPRIVPLPDFAAPNPHLVGEHSRRQRANVVSTDVASVREYAAGDSISRIHWLTTARTGRLMVKQFDQGSSSHLWVLFDQHKDSQAGSGAESTDEYGATLAASVVDRYNKGFLPVGYAGHGSLSVVAYPDRSAAHREHVMEHIASSAPVGDTPLLETLGSLEREFTQSTSLVVITAAVDGDWVPAIAGLQRRGVRVSVALIDQASFGGADNSEALRQLVAAGVRTYRIRKGDSISNALSSAVGPESLATTGVTVRATDETESQQEPSI